MVVFKTCSVLLVVGSMVSGCATVPQKTLATLDRSDPQFNTQECLDGRNLALQFDNKVYTRMGLGLALGLLGPAGLPLAAAADLNANDQRRLMNEELKRRCTTNVEEQRRIEAMRTGQPVGGPVNTAPAAPQQTSQTNAARSCGMVRKANGAVKLAPC